MTTMQDKLIAVETASETTGAVVYWQLSEAINLAELRAAFASEGLDETLLPKETSPEVAFTRAVKEFATRNILVRKHPRGGWAVVVEKRDGKKLDYDTRGRFVRDAEGNIRLLASDSDEELAGPRAADSLARVRAAMAREQSELSALDVSQWLVWLVGTRLDGVPLRDRGGIYFTPKGSIATLAKVKSALQGVSKHRVHEIPALKSEEAIAAILDAVTREVAEWIAGVENDIAESKMGPRAARNRADESMTLTDKIMKYENLLGQRMTAALERVSATRKTLAQHSTRFAQLEVD